MKIKGLIITIILTMIFCMTVQVGETKAGKATVDASTSGEEAAVEAETVAAVEAETVEAAGETYIFTDDCGREVEVPVNIETLVPSGSLTQIIVFALAPERIVGLASKLKDRAKGFIDDKYFELPFLGELYDSADLNVEELALVGPQLIIDIGEKKDSVAGKMDTLEQQTNIPSVHIDCSLANMPETYRRLGSLLGVEEQAEELALFCEKIYNQTMSILEKVGDNKTKTLYVLGENGQNVLAKDSYHAELIDMLTDNQAVVNNPVSRGMGNEVTMEQIAVWNPDFIVFATDSIYDSVAEKPMWQGINAISNGNYVEAPDAPRGWLGNPPSVQRYLGLIWLPQILYPKYCDYDMKAEIMEYYHLFYHCELTEEQYNSLMEHATIK